MANNCFCCGKPLGLFSGDNKILENTGKSYCDKCFNLFGQQIRILKYSDNPSPSRIEEVYSSFSDVIQSAQLPADVYSVVLDEASTLYRQRLEMCTADHQATEDAAQRQIEEELKQAQNEQLMREIMLSTGYTFEGYQIIQYLGVISDGVVQGTGFLSELSADFNDLFGTESNTFAQKLIDCRESALKKLKKQAVSMNANAIIGIDFDTMTLRNNMIGILATGTAVVIRKKNAEADDADSLSQ